MSFLRRFFRETTLVLLHLGLVRPLLNWVVGIRYRRRNLVPRGPCLVVSNHNSHLDAGVLLGLFSLRRLPRVHPVAAADYFGTSWFRRMLAMLLMNAIPIQRRPVGGVDPLAPLIDRLKDGESLIFFPEGSRGEAGVVAKFRPGVGKLVRQLPGVLVVPVFLSGPDRIWPRGEVVPVPTSIDAIVGKPRAYSPALDARAIAEQVQRDVLALAPPAPPEPGSSSTPPPVRVAVCGVDNQDRTRIFRTICERLGRNERAIGISDPVLEADQGGVREVMGPIARSPGHAWLGVLAWLFRTGGMFKGEKFARLVDRAQVEEAVGFGATAPFVVTDGSALVDLVAWARTDFLGEDLGDSATNHMIEYLEGRKRIRPGRWWKFIRNAPEIWLINQFDLASAQVPDVLVLASPPVRRVMERLRSRGEELEPHENEAWLARVEEGYVEVARVLAKRRRVQVFEFDSSRVDDETIADEVEAVCRRLIQRSDPASVST